MIHPRVLHNDDIRSASELMLSPGQLGLLAGWGIFSTIRVYDGVLFAFERHWERMKHDAKLMRIPFPSDPARFEESLMRLVEANKALNSSLRVVVVRNRHGFWEGPGQTREFDVIALTADVNDWGRTVRLGLVPNARHAASPFAGTKILSWAYNLAWYEKAHADGFDEVVLLNERGEVSECTSANIFAAFGGRVVTPPLSSGCLPGITRHVLLHEASAPGFKVEEAVLTTSDLSRADQIFITSTTRELLAVDHVQGIDVRNQGDACQKLQKAFSDYIDHYVASHKRAAV
ncbi:MAG: aminotransferase class IV family protein [Acidobacteria bacterium]|nr:aminotransferase class IV family protein [Acidobacteriota bacterium]